jgi:hypothetical protein
MRSLLLLGVIPTIWSVIGDSLYAQLAAVATHRPALLVDFLLAVAMAAFWSPLLGPLLAAALAEIRGEDRSLATIAAQGILAPRLLAPGVIVGFVTLAGSSIVTGDIPMAGELSKASALICILLVELVLYVAGACWLPLLVDSEPHVVHSFVASVRCARGSVAAIVVLGLVLGLLNAAVGLVKDRAVSAQAYVVLSVVVFPVSLLCWMALYEILHNGVDIQRDSIGKNEQ